MGRPIRLAGYALLGCGPTAALVRPELPEHVDEAVHRALAKKPEERPATGGGTCAVTGQLVNSVTCLS